MFLFKSRFFIFSFLVNEVHSLRKGPENHKAVRAFQEENTVIFWKTRQSTHAVSQMLGSCSAQSLCFASFSNPPLWPALGTGSLSFWVSGFVPTDCLHCSPWRKCLLTAVLSCALSATIAVKKIAPVGRGLRERWPSLANWTGRSSGRLAGPPLGRLLEDQRWKEKIRTAYLHHTQFLRCLDGSKVSGDYKGHGVGQCTCRQSVGWVVSPTPSTNSSPTRVSFGHSCLLRA